MTFFFSSTALVLMMNVVMTWRSSSFFTTVHGFTLTPSRGQSLATTTTSTTTTLFISSWGTKGGGRWDQTLERENPEEKVQAFLKEPVAVEARSRLDGTCLVSGLVNAEERTDQFMFDLLNHEDSAFEFTKIVALVNDMKFSKKRLLSRSARYTGLLDKLDFLEATQPNALPTAEQLQGMHSWLVYLEGRELLDQIQPVAQLAQTCPTLHNVAILLTHAHDLDVVASQAAVQALEQAAAAAPATETRPALKYTLVVVGQLQDHPEGKEFYQFAEVGTEQAVLPATAIFSRQEAYRMVTELLQLECGANKALAFAEVYNVNKTEAKLIKGLREAGYARPQEIDFMVRGGVESYAQAIEEFKKRNPDYAKGYTTNAWWEAEQFQKSRRQSAERDAAAEQKKVDAKTEKIETIAQEWVKREYFRQSMAGTIDNNMTEEEFKESVWDRALLEGDMKYREMQGEVVNEADELLNFKAQQERKKQVMLERAKQELSDMLEGENLGGADLQQKLDRITYSANPLTDEEEEEAEKGKEKK